MKSYTASTTNEKDAITAVPNDNRATIQITVGETEVENGDDATWAANANNVEIVVTNGSKTETYNVVVNKTV